MAAAAYRGDRRQAARPRRPLAASDSRGLARTTAHELEAISEERARLDRLCELNVMRQVRNVASDVFVQDAWARGQELTVHGWVYSLSNGLVNDLNVTVSRPEGRQD